MDLALIGRTDRREMTRARAAEYASVDYILFFFLFSFIGWVWEVLFTLAQTGQLVNRGTMTGPWLPIYGYGGLMALVVLRRVCRRPEQVFVLGAAVCTAGEYLTSCWLEFFTGMRWWDYSGYFMNLNGRVCLAATVLFGGGCCAVVYGLEPAYRSLRRHIPPRATATAAAVLCTAFAVDLIFSACCPNTGWGITAAVMGQEMIGKF